LKRFQPKPFLKIISKWCIRFDKEWHIGGKAMAEPLKVLFLASEADPLIKVGGLGDVAGSLPRALRDLNPDWWNGRTLDVRLAIPFHSSIRQKLANVDKVAEFNIAHTVGPIHAEVFFTEIDQLPVYLIAGAPFGVGEPVYTTDNYRDGLKYTFFSLAALELTRQINWVPDILHANDWHTAISTYVAKYSPDYAWLNQVPSILSVHNLPFMGAGSESAVAEFAIPPSDNQNLPEWARRIPLPMGLAAADRVIAVSPSYAQEIMTPDFGCSLEGFLQSRQDTVMGILNGLDQASWDPRTDPVIPNCYSSRTLDQRIKNRSALIQELLLNPDPKVPLLIIISRMDQQKGIDLAIESLYQVKDYPWQAAILGTGAPLLEANCLRLQEDFPDRVRAILKFDSHLSRRMYAGSDMILMPSRYEPCGLAQMIAMRYGCIPVARATGGLRDTILDADSPASTGFLFTDASSRALSATLIRAIQQFSDRSGWQKLQLRGMGTDFSWQRSALAYAQVYRSLKEQ
jgi:starch synthase